MNYRNLVAKFFPTPTAEWVGDVHILCPETGLQAELCYRSHSFLGLKGRPRTIKGKFLDSSSLKILYEVDGHWDRTVTLKDTETRKDRVIYEAKEVISGLQAPIVKDAASVWPTESALVWSELSKAIMSKDWDKAREVKKAVEETQAARERESKGQIWIPNHFKMSHSKEEGFDRTPIQKRVPLAPIISL